MYHLSNIVSYHKLRTRCGQRLVLTLSISLFLVFWVNITGFAQEVIQENVSITDNTTSEVNKKRLAWTFTLGGLGYTTTSIALYNTWYKDYPLTRFHTFNDLGEWRGVDKAGHIFSGYFQTNLAFKTWRWTGMNKENALWAAAGTSFLTQTTIEIMDGFSENWGFSIPDFMSNIVGIGSFAVQQALWDDQRILIKTSSTPINYEKRYNSQLLSDRAEELFGSGILTRSLKDYNAQTSWLSFNLKSFFPTSKVPGWLNVAVGYGAENMFGGFSNEYGESDVEPIAPKRYSQFYFTLDVDLSKIETNSSFVRTLLDILNIIKVPFSTLEINTLGQVKFHLIKF